MLSDFHPKGAMAQSFGVYKDEHGTTQRATVIVDAAGIVRHASVSGQRDMNELVALCQGIDEAHGGLPDLPVPTGLPADTTLYVRDHCGASRAALLARTNLHQEDSILVKNVSQSQAFMSELKALSGAEVAPVLVVSGQPQAESATIVSYLASACTALPW